MAKPPNFEREHPPIVNMQCIGGISLVRGASKHARKAVLETEKLPSSQTRKFQPGRSTQPP